MDRMNREQFFVRLAPLGEDGLKKALWNLYWRGTAVVRQRIETEIAPPEEKQRERAAPLQVDADGVLSDVRDFVSLVRSGAYMGGDRRVTPKERSRWRFTFARMVDSARDALRADVGPGAEAMEAIIDLACDLRSHGYFHSEDPVEAARLVVSDEVGVLWERLLAEYGFPAFAQRAAGQLIRWESRFGWTRSGWGNISTKETSLAMVLAPLLRTADSWVFFVDCYLEALDRLASGVAAKPKRMWDSGDFDRKRRTENLDEWHQMLVERLGDETGDRLDRLCKHPALGGPELTFVAARLAHVRGEAERARSLVQECLTELPGHVGFRDFAVEIGAPLPHRAQEVARPQLVVIGRTR